jgi:DNA-binding transcriptional ArsR family regulator
VETKSAIAESVENRAAGEVSEGPSASKAVKSTSGQGKATLAKLLSNPKRVQILAAAHRQAISPSEFARAHGLTTSSVAEHFKKLADYGAIKLVKKEPVRGSIRHLYVGTKRGILTAADWQTLPESVQSDIAAAGLQDFIGVAVHAIEEGTFTERSDFVLTWDEVELDEAGWRALTQMLGLVWQKVPRLEEEASMRRQRSREKAVKAIVGLAAFGAPQPARPKRKARSG